MTIKIFRRNKHGIHKITLDKKGLKLYQKYKWYVVKDYRKFYLARTDKKGLTVKFHRELMCVKGFNNKIDHINGDGLDNTRHNLRICSNAQNGANRQKQSTKAKSKFKGVTKSKRDSKWKAYIRVRGKNIHLGYFKDETHAALAYNKKAIEVFGDFANLNEV